MIGIMSKCGLVKLWLEEFDIAILKLLNDTDRFYLIDQNITNLRVAKFKAKQISGGLLVA